MSGQKDFLQFMGITGATLLGLFVLQYWFGSYIDVSYHKELAERDGFEVVQQARTDEAAALAGLPTAMAKLAKSRSVDARITPKQSDDVSAMSGWVQYPGYETYVPESGVRTAAPAPAATQEHVQ